MLREVFLLKQVLQFPTTNIIVFISIDFLCCTNVLFCSPIKVQCIVQEFVMLCYAVLYFTALQCVVLHCRGSALQDVALHCRVLHCRGTAPYGMVSALFLVQPPSDQKPFGLADLLIGGHSNWLTFGLVDHQTSGLSAQQTFGLVGCFQTVYNSRCHRHQDKHTYTLMSYKNYLAIEIHINVNVC